MQNFITSVITDIISKKNNLINTTLILPSKRAGVFIKDVLKIQSHKTTFLPNIISIEEFINDVSKIDTIDTIELVFQFYKVYINNTSSDKRDDFEKFINWANILIQDFNEIDRHLIEPRYIFSYLKDIHRIEKWQLNNKTELTKNYLSFFDKIEIYYNELYHLLNNQKKGYQGLQYREAYNNLDDYIKNNLNQNFIFIGFNALNKVEEKIIQKLLNEKRADIYFDTDHFFINNKLPATRFIEKYRKQWTYFHNNPFTSISNSFETSKSIHVIGLPKNISQIKYSSEILKKLKHFDNTALVLANENLLPVTLNSMPNNVQSVNVTMGYALKNVTLSNLFTQIFKLHKNSNDTGFYYKDVISILNHSTIKSVFNQCKVSEQTIINNIFKFNYIYLTKQYLTDALNHKTIKQLFNVIFSEWHAVENNIKNCLTTIEILENNIDNTIEKEYLLRFHKLFQDLLHLNNSHSFINSLEALQNIYKQLLSTESLSFQGNALKGLQIMGMLETRVLDFETVIITSVNEGFLPSGKLNNSFIPFDVKQEVGLPTYHEKDAIFSYHFYHLLQRAKTVYLLYNTETDDFGSGEQSRFITQLDILKDKLPNLNFTKTIITPKVNNESIILKSINKNEHIIKRLNEIAKTGFSPTSLTNYIYNPLDFYKKRILKIKDTNDVEETIAANTLGTVIHNTLEFFYLPFKGKYMTEKDVVNMQKESSEVVIRYFKELLKNGDLNKGKNRLIVEVAKQFLRNFLNHETAVLKTGKSLKILQIEQDLEFDINIDGIDFPIKLKGQVDRIDVLDGVLRIIDYKTGKVEQTNLNIKDWELLITDHSKSKSFQVLLYAYLYANINKVSFDDVLVESGVISFKNLKSGFIKINKKQISNEDIHLFELELKKLIAEIYNSEVPFVEHENLPY
jgi:hypothetical protein